MYYKVNFVHRYGSSMTFSVKGHGVTRRLRCSDKTEDRVESCCARQFGCFCFSVINPLSLRSQPLRSSSGLDRSTPTPPFDRLGQ